MDVLPVSYLGGLIPDKKGRTRAEGSEKDGDAGIAGGESQSRNPRPRAGDIHDLKKIRLDSLRDYHALSPEQADEMLEDLAPHLAEQSPWRLAELQPVAHRSLIPSAYV